MGQQHHKILLHQNKATKLNDGNQDLPAGNLYNSPLTKSLLSACSKLISVAEQGLSGRSFYRILYHESSPLISRKKSCAVEKLFYF